MSDGNKHWGQWIRTRAAAIGIRRQADFAEMIGCTPQHLCRLLRMAEPPASMRKGLDSLLVAALRIDGNAIFRNWRTTNPLENLTPDAHDDETPLKRKLAACAELLPTEKLRKLVQQGESFLREPAVA